MSPVPTHRHYKVWRENESVVTLMAILLQSTPAGLDRIQVRESFDEAIEKVFPINPPASSLEGRTNALWTYTDGRSALIPYNTIIRVEDDE